MTPFEVYTSYLALKQHFTNPNYDFIKYNGKVSASKISFEQRRDNYFFKKLAKRKDVIDYLLANFIENDGQWIGNIANDSECEKLYYNWLKRKQSLEYIFTDNLNKLELVFDHNIKVYNKDYPVLIKKYMHKEICIETLIIIDDLIGCFKYWDKHIEDTYVYPILKTKCLKYKPFLQYNKEKFKKIIVDKFS